LPMAATSKSSVMGAPRGLAKRGSATGKAGLEQCGGPSPDDHLLVIDPSRPRMGVVLQPQFAPKAVEIMFR
jgi:hypothetical protein